MKYLITYERQSLRCGKIREVGNAITAYHPVEWLAAMRRKARDEATQAESPRMPGLIDYEDVPDGVTLLSAIAFEDAAVIHPHQLTRVIPSFDFELAGHLVD